MFSKYLLLSFFAEFTYYLQGLRLCLLKVVVNDNAVKLWRKAKFVFRPVYSFTCSLVY